MFISKLQFKFSKLIFCVIFCFIFFNANFAQAAEFFFSSNLKKVSVGEEFKIDLFLNTETEELNALQGQIILPNNFFSVSKILDGNSIVPFWLEKPHLENKVIKFSGVIPGGISGPRELLFSLILKAEKSGLANLSLNDFEVYKNDGLGSRAQVTAPIFQINILSQPDISVSAEQTVSQEKIYNSILTEDIVQPEEFSPQIAADKNIFNGQWFLVFATQDKGSGIDHYEIKEGTSEFALATSPYLLKNQKLDENLLVKAVDRSGNARIIQMLAKNKKSWYADENFYGIIILLALCTAYFLWHRKQKK